MSEQQLPCPECNGRTVERRGIGMDMEYKVCSRWREPGHLTHDQISRWIRDLRDAVLPSGRWA